MPDNIKPCPFCGGGAEMRENNGSTVYMGKINDPISVEVLHWCEPMAGGLGRRSVIFAGRDHASAIAMWNRRAPDPAASVQAEICAEILDIMETYREQEASPRGVGTPGGLEHMGDVWRLLAGWGQCLKAASLIQKEPTNAG